MKSGNVLYVVMPAYNEEKNIEQVVESWIKILKNGSRESRLVVADSGSSDNTHKILSKLQTKYKQLELLRTDNQYHGPKVIALYKYAISKGADFIFQTDSDGQTDPNEFEKFWKERNKFDGILGYRKVRGDGKARGFVEKVVCFLLRLFFGIKVKDANAPFRLMRRELLVKYINKLPNDYGLPNIILTAYFVYHKEKITFKVIKFEPRRAGKNSINIKRIFKIGLKALPDFWCFRKKMKKDKKKQLSRNDYLIIAIFAIVSGLLVMISPSFPWNGGMEMTDSSVFLVIGRQMHSGEMPYADTFDHKGPLMYIINYIAILINETKGIFIFEFFAIFFALWYMYKIFRLKNDNILFSGMMTLVLFTPFVNIYFTEGGNLTEQYAIPFISYSLYVFLRYFLVNKVSMMNVFFVGVGFASVLMLRVNMVGIWAVFVISIMATCLIKKQYNVLLKYIKWFLIGTGSVVVPILIWLLANGAFWAFVDSYIMFNLTYSVGGGISGIISAILFFVRDVVVFLSGCLVLFGVMFKKEDKNIAIIYLIAYAICILTACMAGRIFPHYGMILSPLVIFPFAVFCSDLGRNKKDEAKKVFLLLFLISITYTSWLEVAKRSVEALSRETKNTEVINTIDNVCGRVEKYTEPFDKISVYGNWNYVYLKCNRLPAIKYSYQFPIGEIRLSIMDEYFEEIRDKKPKAIIVQMRRWDEKKTKENDARMNEFLETYKYEEELVDDENGIKLFVLGDVKKEHEKNI